MLAQLLVNRNTNDTVSSRDEEKNNNNEHPKTEKSKESSSIDAEVIKGIQSQIASVAQRDELKKVGMICPYSWNGIQCHTHQSSSHLHCTHRWKKLTQPAHLLFSVSNW